MSDETELSAVTGDSSLFAHAPLTAGQLPRISASLPIRWTAYEAKRFGIKMPKKVPMATTERAYTSPIWYTPGR